MESTETMATTTVQNAEDRAGSHDVFPQIAALIGRLNKERLRVAMLLAGVTPERLERAVRLAAPEADAAGEYLADSIEQEIEAILAEFPELAPAEMVVPRMGVGILPEEAKAGVDPLDRIFGNA